MKPDAERLTDILEAIEKIELRTPSNKDDFLSDEMVQVWIIHHLQIMGESASRISKGLRDSIPDIPWGKIIGIRNIIIHGYFDIDLDIVWQAIVRDLPDLKVKIRALMEIL